MDHKYTHLFILSTTLFFLIQFQMRQKTLLLPSYRCQTHREEAVGSNVNQLWNWRFTHQGFGIHLKLHIVREENLAKVVYNMQKAGRTKGFDI